MREIRYDKAKGRRGYKGNLQLTNFLVSGVITLLLIFAIYSSCSAAQLNGTGLLDLSLTDSFGNFIYQSGCSCSKSPSDAWYDLNYEIYTSSGAKIVSDSSADCSAEYYLEAGEYMIKVSGRWDSKSPFITQDYPITISEGVTTSKIEIIGQSTSTNQTPSPTPVPTQTVTSISKPTLKPTPTPVPTPTQKSTSKYPTPTLKPREPYVHLYGHKTNVIVGEEVILYLSVVNPITSPGTLKVQLTLQVPSGWSISLGEFSPPVGGFQTAVYDIEQGPDPKTIGIHMLANQPFDGVITGYKDYYFIEEPESKYHGEIKEPVTAKKMEPSPSPLLPTSVTPNGGMGTEVKSLIIAIIVATIG